MFKRRKRNRRKAEARVMPVRLVSLIVFSVGMALVYLSLYTRCGSFAKDLKAAEDRQKELKKTFMAEESKWIQTRSPANIEKTLAKYGIVMTWPRPDQIVRITDVSNPKRFESDSAVASYRLPAKKVYQ